MPGRPQRRPEALALLLVLFLSLCQLSLGTDKRGDSELKVELAGWGCGGALAQPMGLLYCFAYEDARNGALAAEGERGGSACAMAQWVAAASYWHALWRPTHVEEVLLALEHLSTARTALEGSSGGHRLEDMAERAPEHLLAGQASLPYQAELVLALEVLYETMQQHGQPAAVAALRARLERARAKYPTDPELACLWALALNAEAVACLQEEGLCTGQTVPQGHPLLPADLVHEHQLRTLYMCTRAGRLLETHWLEHPDHPGILHFLIHSYDYPALAEMALPAARHFHIAAPAVPHAHHMPAHIFVRRGLWSAAVRADLVAMRLAQFSLLPRALPGASWTAAQMEAGQVLHDEYLHSMDFTVYAYLQMGRDECARHLVAATLAARFAHLTDPPRGAAYSMLASVARYAFDTRQWAHAAALPKLDVGFDFDALPQSILALRRYSRALGQFYLILWSSGGEASDTHSSQSKRDLFAMEKSAFDLHVAEGKESGEFRSAGRLWEVTVEVQEMILTSCALWLGGNVESSLEVLREAADLEDAYEKPSIKPNVVYPAREQLGLRYLWLFDEKAKKGFVWSGERGDMYKGWLYCALQAFVEMLARTPRRLTSLYGAGHAARELARIPNDSALSLDVQQQKNVTEIAHSHYSAVVELKEEAWGEGRPRQLLADEPLAHLANSAFAITPEACLSDGTHRIVMFQEAELFLSNAREVASLGSLRSKGYLVLDVWLAGVLALCCLAAGYAIAVQQQRFLAKKQV